MGKKGEEGEGCEKGEFGLVLLENSWIPVVLG